MTEPDSLEQQLYDFVYVYDAAFDQAAQTVGFSAAQACLLLQLDKGGSRSMSELADELACDASNVTHLVSRLEARKMVTREPDPADGRARRVSVTPAGRRACRLVEKHFTLPPERVDRLTEPERRQLSRLLAKLLA